MDIHLLRSLLTVAVIAVFFGIAWWTYSPARKQRFERDALLPFEEVGDPEPHLFIAAPDTFDARRYSRAATGKTARDCLSEFPK